MVRTQIQLTEAQAADLKRLAEERGCSMAELVREGVDRLIRSIGAPSGDEVRARALSAAGRFRSGRGDIAERHDAYLTEDLR